MLYNLALCIIMQKQTQIFKYLHFRDEFFTLLISAKTSVDKLEESILQADKAVDTGVKLFIFVIDLGNFPFVLWWYLFFFHSSPSRTKGFKLASNKNAFRSSGHWERGLHQAPPGADHPLGVVTPSRSRPPLLGADPPGTRHPPCEQNSWHTPMKILPCPKLRLRSVKMTVVITAYVADI